MKKDYYFILGVSINAKEKEIKKAYRKLAFKFHPDRHKGDYFYEEIFKNIKEAYETLIDKDKRANYNSILFQNGHKSQSYNNLPPQYVVKNIIAELKMILKLLEGRATPTINQVKINDYLAEILSLDTVLIYNVVPESLKKELILYIVPLFRYINDSKRTEYFRILLKIISNNDALIAYVKKRIDEVIRNQRKIDKEYWLTYKITSFISTRWGGLIISVIVILIFYLFISLLDNNNQQEIYIPQSINKSTIPKNKKNKN
jgi:hypothetical protein